MQLDTQSQPREAGEESQLRVRGVLREGLAQANGLFRFHDQREGRGLSGAKVVGGQVYAGVELGPGRLQFGLVDVAGKALVGSASGQAPRPLVGNGALLFVKDQGADLGGFTKHQIRGLGTNGEDSQPFELIGSSRVVANGAGSCCA